MIEKNYTFEWGDGLVKLDSLSPNQKYFYTIQKPKDLYWGLFVAKISFLDKDNKLIYFNKTVFADPITDSKTNIIKYASYSSNGDLVYFRERGYNIQYLDHILLDLKNERFKIVTWSKINSSEFSFLEHDNFVESELKLFDILNWIPAKKNKRKKKNIFGKPIWYPII
jgi:hypothetical protein